MDSVQQIGRAATRFFSGTMLSRVTGMLRDMAMAATFGGSPGVAALFMAFRFANLPRRMFGEGALHAAFVPQFERMRAEGNEVGFGRAVMALLALVLAGGVLAVEGVLLLWADNQVVGLTALVLPSLVFFCLYGLNSAILNCERVYFLPSMAPVAFNCMWILGTLFAPSVQTLAVVLVGAAAAQWLVTLPMALRALRGSPARFRDLAPFFKALGLAIAGVGATQINSALDPLFARAADASGPAYLWYAIRLEQLPLALIGIGMSGALLPPLARASKDQAGVFLRYAIKRTLLLMIPATIGLVVLAGPIIQLIYGRGAFTALAVEQTATCLKGYALGLIPMALVMLQVTSFHARGNYRTPAKISAFCVLINIFLNALFVFGLGWGALSVALATSISACFQLAFLWKSSLRVVR